MQMDPLMESTGASSNSPEQSKRPSLAGQRVTVTKDGKVKVVEDANPDKSCCLIF